MCSQSFPKEKGCEGHCDAKDLTLRANHTCFRPLNTSMLEKSYQRDVLDSTQSIALESIQAQYVCTYVCKTSVSAVYYSSQFYSTSLKYVLARYHTVGVRRHRTTSMGLRRACKMEYSVASVKNQTTHP